MMSDDSVGSNLYPESLLRAAMATKVPSPTKAQRRVRATKKGGRTQTQRRKTASLSGNERLPSDSASERALEGGEVSCANAHRSEELDVDGSVQEQPEFTFYEDDGEQAAEPHIQEVTANPDDLALFTDAVNCGVAGFKYVHSHFCVVQGWDCNRQQTTVSTIGGSGT